ncbi:VanZ family protein [Kibdelosporangium persicum]|uniref:Antibiotic resistance protein VanZ n=1 Tax=Kibdelosporangium persicum TaxID=2698649 RepID=A0ABX2F087_9PSEU|nr:VanZ family protein [Kibdelosporangium persicum]NRN64638.1 Antibiotic resistance protein VanZ [Kibdelosporangium persicum]
MTATQFTAIHFGLIGFAVVWPIVLLVLRGRVRPLVSGAVTLYAMPALAVVFLPLPTATTPRLQQTIQLLPFQWVLDAVGGDIMAVKQVFLNVLLFVPLGILARVMWQRTARQAVTLGFVASLTIEVTQLSGNFGTAPFVYRIFDVDDLMTNTFGSLIGWMFVNAIMRIRVPERMSALSLPERAI